MRTLLVFLLLSISCIASAAPRADKISWKVGNGDFDGFLVWDDASRAPRPGLVMVPNWYGVNERAIA